jgi:hypothetical protein
MAAGLLAGLLVLGAYTLRRISARDPGGRHWLPRSLALLSPVCLLAGLAMGGGFQAVQGVADRMAARDPGNKPAVGDRIPYMYIVPPPGAGRLQGERIEHPAQVTDS